MRKLIWIIFIIAFLIRFWNFPAWWGFDYDQEINALIAKSILIDHKQTLIGPETSVGGMYVGSYFNYVIAFFFWLSRMNPMGTIALNFLLFIATFWSFYFVTKKLFDPKTTLITVIIYGFSSMAIGYDRVLWNPTPIPLVSLWIFYFLSEYIQKSKNIYLFLTSLFLGSLFHLHFQAFLIYAIVLITLFVAKPKTFLNLKNYIIFVVPTFIFLLPLMIFDFRHDFINSNHLWKFLTNTSPGQNILLLDRFVFGIQVIFLSLRDIFSNFSLAVIIPVLTFFYLLKNRGNVFLKAIFTATCVSILFVAFYKGPLPTQYYFLYLFPLFTIGLANLIAKHFLLLIPILFFLFQNIFLVLNQRSDLSLQNKQKTVSFLNYKANNKPIILDTISDPGLNTGFKYLFWQQKVDVLRFDSKENYNKFKIIIPSTLATDNEITARFGSIGVVQYQ